MDTYTDIYSNIYNLSDQDLTATVFWLVVSPNNVNTQFISLLLYIFIYCFTIHLRRYHHHHRIYHVQGNHQFPHWDHVRRTRICHPEL